MKRIVTIVLGMLILVLLASGIMLSELVASFSDGKFPLRKLETITRYETLIKGKIVQCERHEDHVRGTTETAC